MKAASKVKQGGTRRLSRMGRQAEASADEVKPGGTKRLSRMGKQAEASPGERQLQQLKASLSDVQAQGKSVAQQLRYVCHTLV